MELIKHERASVPAGDLEAWLADGQWHRVHQYAVYNVSTAQFTGKLRAFAKRHGCYVEIKAKRSKTWLTAEMQASYVDFVFWRFELPSKPTDLAS